VAICALLDREVVLANAATTRSSSTWRRTSTSRCA
jgi:hypothetical protein